MIRSQERKRKLGRANGWPRAAEGGWLVWVKEVIEKGGGGGARRGGASEAVAPTFTHFQCNSPGTFVSFFSTKHFYFQPERVKTGGIVKH